MQNEPITIEEREPITIEERVQRMEDPEEIRHLLTAYAKYHDHANYHAFAELFALSGQLDLGPAGQATGRAAIRALIENLVQHRTAPVRHIVSSPVIRQNATRATASVMWTMLSCSSAWTTGDRHGGHHKDIIEEGRVDIGSLPQRQEQ